MKKLQNSLLILYAISINYELWDPFNTNIDFLITKVTTILYLLSTLFNFKEYYSIKKNKMFLIPIWVLFILITILNTGYSSDFNKVVFIAFLLNILTMHVILNHARMEVKIISKVMRAFLISTIVLSIFYFFDYKTSYTVDSRITIFNMNQNELGIKLAIALLIIIAGLKEIGVQKKRLLYYFISPLLFIFLIQTGSRVAFIALCLGSLLFYVFNGSFSTSKIFKIILVTLSFILLWNYFILNTFISKRLITAFTEGDISGRNTRWAAAYEIFKNHPLIGVGQLGYNEKIEPLLGYYSSPHNVLIEVLSYSGIIGMALFMFFLINIITSAIRAKKQNGFILPLILLVPLFGVILSGQILASKIIWLIFSYIIASSKIVFTEKIKSFLKNESAIRY